MNQRAFIFFFPIIFSISIVAHAVVLLPRNLDHADRQQAIRVLGFGTTAKIVSDPYPLGGYSGFEVGISMENVPVADLGNLGDTLPLPQQEIAYPRLSVGKGLYNDVDFFIHFIPYSQKTELSQYGGILRWGFYQAKFLPLSFSTFVHFSNTNISNQLATRSIGIDLVAGINVDNVALFVGGGPLESRGRFIGGPTGLTDSQSLEIETAKGFHTVIGASVQITPLFVVAQIDKYDSTVYSAKVGMRF